MSVAAEWSGHLQREAVAKADDLSNAFAEEREAVERFQYWRSLGVNSQARAELVSVRIFRMRQECLSRDLGKIAERAQAGRRTMVVLSRMRANRRRTDGSEPTAAATTMGSGPAHTETDDSSTTSGVYLND